MKSALALICVTSLLLAEEVRLDPISVEDRMTNDTIFVANEEDFLATRSIYLPTYHLLEAQLLYKISKSIDARVGVKNILDQDYEQRYGYPAEGRCYYLSLQWQL
jgi:outer membrane receptor for ferrienterochelin and colicin